MAGSSGSGEDIDAGRMTSAESPTVIQGGRPSELDVPFNGLTVFEAGARRDEQRPDGTLTGATGRGWNGAGTPAQRQPGAGVLGIGAPNRGPGLVGLGGGHRVTSTFLGSPGNLGESGLGGSGVVGLGGPGDAVADSTASADVAMDAPSLPGVGVAGQGGPSFFSTPVAGSADPGTGNGAGVVGIAGGRRRRPNADLTQADLASTANVGAVGFGVSGDSSRQAGVVGTAVAGPGVLGGSTDGVGVVGNSGTAVGGSFSSQRVAQIHLEPLRDPLSDPNGTIPGRAGDRIVLKNPRESQLTTLWFCRTMGDATTVSWVQVA